MLIRFRVQNHRSIRSEQQLSLVASALSDDAAPTVEVTGLNVELLAVLAIYGANASGKSTVLDALRFMAAAVLRSQSHWRPEGPIPSQPFLLDSKSARSSSLYELDFLLHRVRYRYGFDLDSKRVRNEWLFAYPKGREQVWFVREGSKIRFGKNLKGPNRAIHKLTRPNSLYLSAAAQNNHEVLTPIQRWFATQLDFVGASDRRMLAHITAEWIREQGTSTKHLEFLRAADLGVTEIRLKVKKPDERMKKLMASLEEIFELKRPKEAADEASALEQTEVSLLHRAGKGPAVELNFRTESDGTLAWFGMLGPVFRTLESGGVLCIDELDSSLHPLLAVEIVRRFNDKRSNPKGAQLIFNTHDTNLLDFKVLRRDQVWFTEKDDKGSTHLYPLTDFQPRKGEKLERGYLQGRYGAIPFVGSLVESGDN